MSSVHVRDLEQIQESEGDARATRVATLLLASIGGAALVVAGVVTLREGSPGRETKADPLAALVARAARPEGAPAESVRASEVTFPAALSDSPRPTTALAAVKDPRGRLVDPALDPAPSPGAAPPPATDRLPVVPLPAGALLDATPVTLEPRDALAILGSEVSTPRDAPVPAGAEGGYQLQVASFKDQAEADRFAEALRRRGHRAHRQAAYVGDRGLWHRVRVGPFETKVEAERYRVAFERAEKMTTFLVDPDKLKRQEEARAAKLALERDRAR